MINFHFRVTGKSKGKKGAVSEQTVEAEQEQLKRADDFEVKQVEALLNINFEVKKVRC